MSLNFIKKIKESDALLTIRKNGFWFVDIPRTSSTSIKLQLGEKFGFTYSKNRIRNETLYKHGIFYDHINASRMKKIMGDKLWDQTFTFSMVRNPWDRAISIYNYIAAGKSSDDPMPTFKEHLLKMKEEFIGEGFGEKDLFKNGCFHYISERNEIVVNKVIKYESREEGLREVSEKIGFNISPDIHHGKTQELKSYKKHYDSETKEIIELIYAKDIEQFGYSFD